MAAPLVCISILAGLVAGVLRSVAQWDWNDVRLARGIALWYGYSLYPGRDSTVPIIGTMHGPLPHLLYGCLAFLKDPTFALIAGCTLSALLYFGAVFWLHLRSGGILAALYGFCACTALLLASRAATDSAFKVHVDACAIFCTVLAAGILMRAGPLRPAALTMSAVFIMLAVACKQTMAPSALALPCFVWMTDGRPAFARYFAVQIAAAAAIFAAMLAIFRPARDLLFNTFTLAADQPRTASVVPRTLEGLVQIRSDLAVIAAPLLFLIAMLALSPAGTREKLAQHRWLVFLWMAAFQLPIELRAWSTEGGWLNHLGVITLLVSLATTVGLVGLWKSDVPWTAVASRALLIGILLAHLPLPLTIRGDIQAVRSSATQVAYDYARQHPGKTYFPVNPLAALLAEGRLTHLDSALYDREIAGFPINSQQLAAGLPARCQLVAFPPRHAPRAAILRELVKGQPPVQEPGLEGWSVYHIRPYLIFQPTSGSRP
jgi:hypothetical protein